MGSFVGDNGIEFSMREAGLVNRNMAADILWEDKSLSCVLPMFPILKTTELISIISP